MNDEYHILYFKDGNCAFLISTLEIANKLFARDRAIVKMSSFFHLHEMLDHHFSPIYSK